MPPKPGGIGRRWARAPGGAQPVRSSCADLTRWQRCRREPKGRWSRGLRHPAPRPAAPRRRRRLPREAAAEGPSWRARRRPRSQPPASPARARPTEGGSRAGAPRETSRPPPTAWRAAQKRCKRGDRGDEKRHKGWQRIKKDRVHGATSAEIPRRFLRIDNAVALLIPCRFPPPLSALLYRPFSPPPPNLSLRTSTLAAVACKRRWSDAIPGRVVRTCSRMYERPSEGLAAQSVAVCSTRATIAVTARKERKERWGKNECRPHPPPPDARRGDRVGRPRRADADAA